MLKLLLILSVMIAQPIPRQVSANPAGDGSSHKHYSNAKHESTANPTPIVEQTSGPERETPSRAETDRDTDHPIAIRELPSVSITKDWADWGVWWFSGLLVIVSGFQAFLLWRTLREIHSQATQMETQTTILGESVAIAKQSADTTAKSFAAMIDKERARLSLHIAHFEFGEIPRVFYKLTCHGTTPAYIRSSWEMTSFLPIPDFEWLEEAHGFPLRELPEVVPNETLTGDTFIMQIAEGTSDDALNSALEKGEGYIHFRVRILYADVFGGEQTLEVTKVYGVKKFTNLAILSGLLGVFGDYPHWRDSAYRYGDSD